MTNETKDLPCTGCPSIRFSYKTHRPYCTKHGIYIDEKTVPCDKDSKEQK